MTKVLTEADTAADLARLPRAVSRGRKRELNKLLNDFAIACAYGDDLTERMSKSKAIHDYCDALAGRVAELESEVLDQCRLNGMGSERELALMGRVAELEAERDAAWKPLESAPKEPGRYIYVQQHAVYRWLPYKANSHEFKRGKKGRWQQHTGYGFDNAELSGTGWKDTEDAALTANTPESKP